VKRKPRALLLAGIRAYADLHEEPSGNGTSPGTEGEHVRPARSVEPLAAGGSGDAPLDSFAAAFVAETEDSPGALRNLRY